MMEVKLRDTQEQRHCGGSREGNTRPGRELTSPVVVVVVGGGGHLVGFHRL